MKISFICNGLNTYVQQSQKGQITDKLKPAVYYLSHSELSGFFLTFEAEKFDSPHLYGNVEPRAARVLDTFESVGDSLGVLCSGLKGAGKSLQARTICNEAIERGYPVIIVNGPYRGDGFQRFMDALGEVCVFFDEFGKMYPLHGDDLPQEAMLSFFDGTSTGKRLHILTENRVNALSEYLIGRPSRLFYHFRYTTVSQDTVKEYCEHRNIPEDVIKDIQRMAASSVEFSFDILAAVVQEWERYKTPIDELESVLNIPGTYTPHYYSVAHIYTSRPDIKNIKFTDQGQVFQVDSDGDIYVRFTFDTEENSGSEIRESGAYFNIRDFQTARPGFWECEMDGICVVFQETYNPAAF